MALIVAGTYSTLDRLKDRVGITGTSNDTHLRFVLETTSRLIDDYCKRWFYVRSDTFYYDGNAGIGRVVSQFTEEMTEYANKLWVHDLLSVTSIGMDNDGDADWEDTLAATDYILWPYSEFPKERIDLDLRQGDYTFWPQGQQANKVVGLWGYGNGQSATPYSDSGTTTAEELDASETAVDVASGPALEPGQTILVESEQMYIQSIASNTLTVVRGVNGTTAATHATAKTVYVYQYPDLVIEACLMQAARAWERRESSYATLVGGPEIGPIKIHRGLDTDVKIYLETGNLVKHKGGYRGAI